jgi:hypothetical protein
MTLLTAREYYYHVISPEEDSLRFNGSHPAIVDNLKQLFGDAWGVETELNRVPKFSNDPLLDAIMEEFIRNAADNPLLKLRLSTMFVAKRPGLSPQAYVGKVKQDYAGDLVFYNLGLSHVSFQYSSLFAEFMYLMNMRWTMDDSDPLVRKMIETVHFDGMRLTEQQKGWGLDGDIVTAEKSTILEVEKLGIPEIAGMAGGFSSSADRFILAHEISHHILGHTGSKDDGSNIITSLPASCQSWQYSGLPYLMELQADALALCLMSGLLTSQNFTKKVDDRLSVNVGLGTLLIFTVLGQISQNVMKASSTHPSISDRYDQCLSILKEISTDDVYQFVLKHIEDFQHFLFIRQRRGLWIKLSL